MVWGDTFLSSIAALIEAIMFIRGEFLAELAQLTDSTIDPWDLLNIGGKDRLLSCGKDNKRQNRWKHQYFKLLEHR